MNVYRVKVGRDVLGSTYLIAANRAEEAISKARKSAKKEYGEERPIVSLERLGELVK